MGKIIFAMLAFALKALGKIRYLYGLVYMANEKRKLGLCGKSVNLKYPNSFNRNMYIEDYAEIKEGAHFIMNPYGERFIMRKRAVAARGLTVITGKHGHIVGRWSYDVMRYAEKDTGSTIIVGEDVMIGANVTLLPGITIGRGAQIGACSVVTKDVPPYTIAVGNPARVIGFVFTPEEILKHEQILYEQSERLSKEEIMMVRSTYANLQKKHL